jgi:uncharacterized UBP type Zn finger protein
MSLELVHQLFDMGFSQEHAAKAVSVLGPSADVQSCIDWIFAHPHLDGSGANGEC